MISYKYTTQIKVKSVRSLFYKILSVFKFFYLSVLYFEYTRKKLKVTSEFHDGRSLHINFNLYPMRIFSESSRAFSEKFGESSLVTRNFQNLLINQNLFKKTWHRF